MEWFQILIFIVVGILIFKFLVKPLFKIVGIVILALIAWWIYNGL